MPNKTISDTYRKELIDAFTLFIVNNFNENTMKNIVIITNSLLFTLLPLHNNDKCKDYFNLIKGE